MKKSSKKKATKKKTQKTKTTACRCIELTNQKLEEMGSNTRLSSDSYINFQTGRLSKPRVRLATEKANSRKREPLKPIYPRYCPICGRKY